MCLIIFYFKIFFRFQNEVTRIGKSISNVFDLASTLINILHMQYSNRERSTEAYYAPSVDCAQIVLIRASIFRYLNKDLV